MYPREFITNFTVVHNVVYDHFYEFVSDTVLSNEFIICEFDQSSLNLVKSNQIWSDVFTVKFVCFKKNQNRFLFFIYSPLAQRKSQHQS